VPAEEMMTTHMTVRRRDMIFLLFQIEKRKRSASARSLVTAG